jgi:asparagine synthase (glutamine-hydrolysing)
MYNDMVSYLPDDILVKVDRASMGVSLEVRVPILDHKLVEFVARLPMNMLIKGDIRKYVLRRILYKYLPMNLIERPKKGFSMPLGEWLRGPLRDWGEFLLDDSRLRSEGFLDATMVKRKWQEHLSGVRDWKNQLWNVMMFEAWLESDV